MCPKMFDRDVACSCQFHIEVLIIRDDEAVNAPIVLTSTTKRSFQMVLLAVSQKWPVLLYGPTGVGKSALIGKLARDSGNPGNLH